MCASCYLKMNVRIQVRRRTDYRSTTDMPNSRQCASRKQLLPLLIECRLLSWVHGLWRRSGVTPLEREGQHQTSVKGSLNSGWERSRTSTFTFLLNKQLHIKGNCDIYRFTRAVIIRTYESCFRKKTFFSRIDQFLQAWCLRRYFSHFVFWYCQCSPQWSPEPLSKSLNDGWLKFL
jgi:hypothetical protein